VQRFMLLRESAVKDEQAFFHQFTRLNPEEARKFAERVWETINEVNLIENVQPYKERADLILTKVADHSVQEVYLRKL
jgi:type I pantothenate kinase